MLGVSLLTSLTFNQNHFGMILPMILQRLLDWKWGEADEKVELFDLPIKSFLLQAFFTLLNIQSMQKKQCTF